MSGFLEDGTKRLSHLRVFCGKFVEEAKKQGVYVDRPTPDEVTRMFQMSLPGFGVLEKTPKGRKRNLFALKRTQLLKLHREEGRKASGSGVVRRQKRKLGEAGKAGREEVRWGAWFRTQMYGRGRS